MIPPESLQAFDRLTHAFAEDAVYLLACRDKATGQPAYVLCAVQPRGQAYEYVPLARLLDGDPQDLLERLPPAPAPAIEEPDPDADMPLGDGMAMLIAEGVLLQAWQHLVDTGMAWRLQGWFGRTAAALIDDGLIRAPGRQP
jgi:hypothetical protein